MRWNLAFIAIVLLLAGCLTKQPPTIQPPPPTMIRLLVVADPALARTIGKLKTEWKAQKGDSLEIAEVTEAALLAAKSLAADAVVFPSYQLGTLVEREWLSPITPEQLQLDALACSDVFDALRRDEATWGQATYGVPFGSPVLTCYYRVDLLKQLGRESPKTWAEYQELATLLADRERLGAAAPDKDAPWHGVIEPLGPGWAGRTLLARAATYARHRDNYSTLFSIDTLEPLIAGPPFVRALEELVAAAKLGPSNAVELDPAAVRREFLLGHAGLALSWPTAAVEPSEKIRPFEEKLPTGFVELPGSSDVYSVSNKSWQKRDADDSGHVPLLAVDGRLGAIPQQSAAPQQALELLAWLSGRKWGDRVCAASEHTTLFRRSQVRTPERWVDAGTDPQAAREYAESVQDALERNAVLFALRLPGQLQYSAALDKAVHAAVSGEKSPTEALTEAAAAWEEISKQLGREKQLRAYRRSLGLEP